MNFDSDSEVEEIKISDDLKAKYQQKQKELEDMNKKRSRKKTKKNLLDKYKNELHKDIDLSNKSKLNLLKNRKIRNQVTKLDDEDDGENLFEKDNFLLKVLPSKPKFKKTPKDILEFRKSHFFGGRVKRANINKILSRK